MTAIDELTKEQEDYLLEESRDAHYDTKEKEERDEIINRIKLKLEGIKSLNTLLEILDELDTLNEMELMFPRGKNE